MRPGADRALKDGRRRGMYTDRGAASSQCEPQFDTYLPAPALRARGLDPVSGRHRRGSAGRRDDRAAISVSRRSYYRRPYGLKASDYGASQRYHELWVARDGGRDPDFPVDVA